MVEPFFTVRGDPGSGSNLTIHSLYALHLLLASELPTGPWVLDEFPGCWSHFHFPVLRAHGSPFTCKDYCSVQNFLIIND